MKVILAEIIKVITKFLQEKGVASPVVELVVTDDPMHGDYASNAAMMYAKVLAVAPKELAEEIVKNIEYIKGVKTASVAGPGFLNITLKDEVFGDVVKNILDVADKWGSNNSQKGKTIMVEHSQPNPFKPFHIGHLMSNTIGESIARLMSSSGARVIRANYQGDVGMHVAKALWGVRALGVDVGDVSEIGRAYAHGAKAYESDTNAKAEIEKINIAVYEKSDDGLNEQYARGREESLKHFEKLYAMLGSSFDRYYFESETAPVGIETVMSHTDTVFTRSDGAVVFTPTQENLHTRVFVTSRNLPTYEAKELGLIYKKFGEYPELDVSITTTAVEQEEYFRVVFSAVGHIWPDYEKKLKCVTHGMMMLSTGKMSSRKGDVVTGESLLNGLLDKARMRAQSSRADDVDALARGVAVAGIKYQVLRQTLGKNIIYDEERALSLEGDSGPYVQYAHARARSVVTTAQTAGVSLEVGAPQSVNERLVARRLSHFPDIVARAQKNMEPHHVAQYAGDLAGLYNSWYAKERVVGDDAAPRRAALTMAVVITLSNALYLLGIKAPEKM